MRNRYNDKLSMREYTVIQVQRQIMNILDEWYKDPVVEFSRYPVILGRVKDDTFEQPMTNGTEELKVTVTGYKVKKDGLPQKKRSTTVFYVYISSHGGVGYVSKGNRLAQYGLSQVEKVLRRATRYMTNETIVKFCGKRVPAKEAEFIDPRHIEMLMGVYE